MTKQEIKPFKDISAYQGIYEYFDYKGIKWRRESEGSGFHKFWKQNKDEDFHYMGQIRTQYKGNEDIHKAFEQKLYEFEE